MTPGSIALVPFAPAARGLRLTARVAFQDSGLRLSFAIAGTGLADLDIPPRAANPGRRDLLWKATCFECFFARQGEDRYWEVNLSPAGHWNVYALADYRHGLMPEPSVAEVSVTGRHGGAAFDLIADLPLPAGLDRGAPLAVNLCSVLRYRDGDLGYWALAHPGVRPDFHHRAGFVAILEP